MPRKTKFICTLGPATEAAETIGKLIDGGVNVFRINMSHAKHEWAREMVNRVRQQATQRQQPIAVLFDLAGPSIRTGTLDQPYELKGGDLVEFRLEGTQATQPISTTVNYNGIMKDVRAGNTLVVDNGVLLMRIHHVQADRMLCEVTTPGTMGSRRHINLPGVRLNLPALTEKDHLDLDLAIQCDADFIAGSFVRDAAHVAELRAAIEHLGGNAQIVAKLEDQEAIRNLDAIIRATDVIMVARGDLGTEVAYEELPILQRRIIRRCHELNKRVIVATQLLESMISNPTPTRAEVTDVMNAAYEEADALMLSGETSVGRYPERCVEALLRISSRIERSGGLGFGQQVVLSDDRQKAARAAVNLADSFPDSALIILTRRGILANHTAMLRPRTTAFFAFSPDARVCRQLALSRGIHAFQLVFADNIETTVKQIAELLVEAGLIKRGCQMVLVSDIFADNFVANSILMHQA